MAVPQSRSLDTPDEVRRFPEGEAAIVHLEGVSIGRGRLRPGWSFAASMKPLVGGESCPLRHVGYALSGRLSVTMDDGAMLKIGPTEAYVIPAGHQAEVEGDEDFVAIEFDAGAIAGFGKAP
jgi:hypothetical protein